MSQVSMFPRHPITCEIAGISFRPIMAQAAIQHLPDQSPLRLVAEPDNKWDPNAIKVFEPGGEHVGYIPKRMNKGILANGLETATAVWDASAQQVDITWSTDDLGSEDSEDL